MQPSYEDLCLSYCNLLGHVLLISLGTLLFSAGKQGGMERMEGGGKLGGSGEREHCSWDEMHERRGKMKKIEPKDHESCCKIVFPRNDREI